MKDTENSVQIIREFDPSLVPPGSLNYYWLHLISDSFANPISIPLIVAKGKQEGPTLGLTAAVHGNELNGIPVIQRLFTEIDVNELRGMIVGVPVVNVPSFMRKKRRFNDGVDLNHIFPGKKDGNVSQVYAYRFINKLVRQFDILLDLHTASFGRINSYYVRADMDKPGTRKLALLQNAEIIVHNPPSDGTLRGAADELNIPSITLEVGNPNTFQKKLIRSGIEGIHNVLCHMEMVEDEIQAPEQPTIVCQSSYWIYADRGGILNVQANLLDVLNTGDVIASQRDIFGHKIKDYFAPEKGIVIGKSVNPVNQTGGRILHLGIMK